VILGVSEASREIGKESDDDGDRAIDAAKNLVDNLEVGDIPVAFERTSPTTLLDFLGSQTVHSGRRRTVLLFDDAAHAFSAQQQREFFEIFRQLRTRSVAPKAAVYPGVTNYSANMHMGHDAELLEAWCGLDDSSLLEVMQ
ncbi:MAG: hypothetical protein ACRCYU_16240, partial [Nocardioides sp.]